MNAQDLPFTQLLDGAKQFIVPIFQRDYSWGTKHCLQLWNDVVRVGQDPKAKGHFLGSVVYVAAEENTAGITRWLLIDGQQRITTLSLLMLTLRNHIKGNNGVNGGAGNDAVPTAEEIDDYYLRNRHGKGDRKSKLFLRRTDQETLAAMVEGKEMPKPSADHICENYQFFAERVADANLEVIFNGIKKLVIVDVCLTRGQDDPQMIFESLNSTGLDLTQADLIRNFVLMRQDETAQTELYQEYWQPIEVAFGPRYRSDFDKFVRDYLTLHLKPSKQLKADEIYQHFCSYFHSTIGTHTVADILANLKRLGRYYVAYSLGQEVDDKLKEPFRRLRLLVEVASPVILKLYDCYDRAKSLSREDFAEAVELLEAYVFRRSVCDMQTRSLGQIFASLAYRIKEDAPLLSLKVALHRQGKRRRFPTDAEFREALETRHVYDMRNCDYLLDRIENDSKERIDTENCSIEHVMPQNEELCPEWQILLGENWKTVQEVWLHRLGNVTLTGYNSEYSDLPFEKKKTLVDKDGKQVGFNFSPLRLNKFIREHGQWTATEMDKRGKELAAKAVGIWPALAVDLDAVKQTELEDRKVQAAKYSLHKLEFDAHSQSLFDTLKPQIIGLGDDVVELCGSNSVAYHVYDFFVEVIPRKRRLSLVLNLDYEECDDPTQRAIDTTEYAFITHASESGGVLLSVENITHIAPAMHLIRQAHQRVTE